MTDKRIFENGYRYATDYSQDRHNGCLVVFMWAVVVVVLGLAILVLNSALGSVIESLIAGL